VLGNPPWERVKLQQEEFFRSRDPVIADAPNKAARERMIKELPKNNSSLFFAYESAVHEAEGSSLFLRLSGRYPLTGVGDVNTYAVFTEISRFLLNSYGRTGIIVPTGIATDATTAPFFSDLITKNQLSGIVLFENESFIFPSVHHSFKFSSITLVGLNIQPKNIDFIFFVRHFSDIEDQNRHFTLTSDEIRLINPNTGNCPIFRTKKDAEITKRIYYRIPVLIDETKENYNQWGISFLRMFDMSGDSHLFRTKVELLQENGILDGNTFHVRNERWLPLYEAKMFYIYNHRYGSYPDDDDRGFSSLPKVKIEEHGDHFFYLNSWYFVSYSDLMQKIKSDKKWFLSYRDITSAVVERTGIISIIPFGGIGHTAPIIFTNQRDSINLCFLGNFSSIIFDYIIRQKIGGTHLTYFIVKQLPVLPPSTYAPELQSFILPRVIELTYTAWDLEPFAQDILTEIGPDTWNQYFPVNPLKEGRPHPFRWDEGRRAILRSELDALYAKLYGLTTEELEYILTTFPVLEKNEIREFGEYRTRRLVLEAWERIGGRESQI
jgi:hypothetical protein